MSLLRKPLQNLFISNQSLVVCYCRNYSLCSPGGQPNAIARIVNLDSSTKKIIIVAKRNIKPGEEVRRGDISRVLIGWFNRFVSPSVSIWASFLFIKTNCPPSQNDTYSACTAAVWRNPLFPVTRDVLVITHSFFRSSFG